MSRMNVFGALALAGALAFAMNCNNSTPSNPPAKNPLQLLAPTGQSYKVGDTIKIRWTINDQTKVSSVKVMESSDNGIYWPTISNTSHIYPDTSFNWVVGDSLASKQCQIMIADYVEKSITDQSKTFTVTP